MSRREKLLSALDSLAFKISTRKYGLFGPTITYQDLPWSNIEGSRRAAGSRGRFEAMQGLLRAKNLEPRTVLDVGCNVGYFALSFAGQGSFSYGVEMDPLPLRTAVLSSKHIADRGTFIPVALECTPQSVVLLPQCDVSICLSIWHHWVRHQGLSAATQILRELWAKTDGVLFFDTGENEMPPEYNLPFRDGDAVQWLSDYLRTELKGGSVSEIGRFAAFAPNHRNEEDAQLTRSLFAISRS
ncbi:MAG: hypothetical protein EOP22_10755 [Hyphomicrobiales bacterium]|nr:MAG: hypothetical protein EOP22_10755 [Hyphomicrobiales bacterium]